MAKRDKAEREAPVRVGDRPTVTIDAMVGGGEAIGRVDGFPIFVPLAVPGDVVRARVISTKPGYARALIEELVTPGPGRQQAPCAVFGRCGGCQWQTLAYDDQVAWKTRIVAEALQRLGGIDPEGVLRPCLPSPSPWAYRNKVHWAVSKEKGKWRVGLYEPRSHVVVDAPSCGIQDDVNNRVLQALRELLALFDFPLYDEAKGTGWLRSAFAKRGHRTDELMLGLVTRTADFPEAERFVAEARKRLPELTTIVQNVHGKGGNKLLGPETLARFGPGVIRERVAYGPAGQALTFAISAQSFFQVNAAAIELLYDQAARACGLPPEGPAGPAPTVIDAYSGTGSIALFLAARGAADVLGIEIVADATRDAAANAAANGLGTRARFETGAVEAVLPALAAQGDRPDVIVLDPPRKGCEPEVLAAVAAMAPARLAYVSCNPATLARDLKILAGLGYAVRRVQPVDMFPQTSHVECVARLERGDP
jgi:23S rRNA (uracil1939-C5)-methyltransferase